jgi:hypothetical protein
VGDQTVAAVNNGDGTWHCTQCGAGPYDATEDERYAWSEWLHYHELNLEPWAWLCDDCRELALEWFHTEHQPDLFQLLEDGGLLPRKVENVRPREEYL